MKGSSRVSVRKFQKQSCPLAVHSQSHLTQKGAMPGEVNGPARATQESEIGSLIWESTTPGPRPASLISGFSHTPVHPSFCHTDLYPSSPATPFYLSPSWLRPILNVQPKG